MEAPETVNITDSCPRYTNKLVNLLVNALDGYMHESTIKLKITYHNESANKLVRTGSAWGTEPGVLNK